MKTKKQKRNIEKPKKYKSTLNIILFIIVETSCLSLCSFSSGMLSNILLTTNVVFREGIRLQDEIVRELVANSILIRLDSITTRILLTMRSHHFGEAANFSVTVNRTDPFGEFGDGERARWRNKGIDGLSNFLVTFKSEFGILPIEGKLQLSNKISDHVHRSVANKLICEAEVVVVAGGSEGGGEILDAVDTAWFQAVLEHVQKSEDGELAHVACVIDDEIKRTPFVDGSVQMLLVCLGAFHDVPLAELDEPGAEVAEVALEDIHSVDLGFGGVVVHEPPTHAGGEETGGVAAGRVPGDATEADLEVFEGFSGSNEAMRCFFIKRAVIM